jgi:hypothetical protein
VQNETAGAVVTAVLPRFSASGKSALPPPEDPVAYDLYLLGRQKLREADDLNMRADSAGARMLAAQAADLFRQAIASDPGFAQAHASLARSKLNLTYNRISEGTPEEQAAALDREVLPEDVERALELDPMDLQNHVASIMAAWIMARPDEAVACAVAVAARFRADPWFAQEVLWFAAGEAKALGETALYAVLTYPFPPGDPAAGRLSREPSPFL